MVILSKNKTGDDLKAQRFQMLEDIAKELSGEVVFPTHFDAVLRLRKVLQDPNETISGIANAVSMEPLISAKLLNLANSVAFNPQGMQVIDLKSAVTRLGINAVRATALSIVMTQLLRAKGMASFSDLTHKLWEHSIRTAAAARVLARKFPRFNADEAMLAGLVHDLGAFYMLYRATQYEELRERPDTVRYLIVQWHESIGISLLGALGLPDEIVNATDEHDRLRPPPAPLRTLGDLVYVANMLSGGHFEWLMQDIDSQPDELNELNRCYDYLQSEIDSLYEEIKNSLS